MSLTLYDPNGATTVAATVPETDPDLFTALVESSLPDLSQTGDPGEPFTGLALAVPNGATKAPPQPPQDKVQIARRTVSGRYRGTTGAFQLELRVDVDGAKRLDKVSGDYVTTAGNTTTYVGSWIIQSPTIAITQTQVIVEGIATCTWNTAYTKARLEIPRNIVLLPPAPAKLSWFNAANAPGAVYTCAWEQAAWRTVQWEQDSVIGTVPFASYHTGSLPQPPSSPARQLSVNTAFEEAGLQLLSSGLPNVIGNQLSGPDTRWDEAELHAAMQANFSLWSNVQQWRVYSLVASRYVSDGVRGIMYDYGDAHQRQGMAVFHNAVQGNDAASQRAQLRTYVHELGHCFNLLHSWDKQFADPPQPLGPNGGLGDLSWMNYAWKFQPPPPAAGGEAAYWAAFPFQFTANELVHLRHGFRTNVIMGGHGFGTGSAEIDPIVFADRESDRAGLALDLRGLRSVVLGEPVVVELKLSSLMRTPVRTHARLNPRDGLVRIAVQDPSGRVRAYRPLMPRCVDEAATTVLDDTRPSCYESAYIGYGRDGWMFDQIGTYRLRAVYVADDGSQVVSPTMSLRVRAPHSAEDDAVSELLQADGQGELLYLLGSDAPALAGATAAMDELLDRHGEHRLAVYARLVKGMNDERSFKQIQPDKQLRMRPARTNEAMHQLRQVVHASTERDAGVDNLTLHMVLRTLARAQLKAGDAGQATDTLDQLPGVFERRGVKPAVVDQIRTEAYQEKARLLADYSR